MVHISDSKRQLSRDSLIRLGHCGQAGKLENQGFLGIDIA
jgi:hypothetical protein